MAVFLVIGGATSYAYAIGGICGFVENRDRATKEFHVAVDQMNLFMADNGISRELKLQTRAFFQRARPVIRAQFYTETLRTCSPQLRAKIVLQLHTHWFEKLTFFNTGPEAEQKAAEEAWAKRRAEIVARDEERRRGPVRVQLERQIRKPAAPEPEFKPQRLTAAQRMDRAWRKRRYLTVAS